MKSGWATTVLLGGPPRSPRVLDRRRIELSDPSVPKTTQPYHAAFGRAETDASAVERLARIVSRCAHRSVASLVGAYGAMGYRPTRIAIVVGSITDATSIANQHIRAHAQEGCLFRTVLEAAAKRHGIRPAVMLERDLYAAAAQRLGGSPGSIQGAVAGLGRAVGPPWRSDEKAAAVAAWLLLAGAPEAKGRGMTRVRRPSTFPRRGVP